MGEIRLRLPPGLGALNHRDFRLFFAGQLVSLIGTWMQSVGQSWLVLELTTSPFRLGLIDTLQFTPVLLFALVAGAWVDRLPKRRLIVATQIAFMLQAFVLAVLDFTHLVRYWQVAVLALIYGVVNAFDMPARQSFIVEMVGKGDLSSAIALNAAMFNGARIAGPAVAGLLIARYGTAFAFLLNGLSFVAVIIALFYIRAQGLPGPRRETRLGQEVREGLAYAWRTPLISLVLSLLLAISLFVINFNVLVPLLSRDVLGQGADGFGLLMAAYGAGALLGALTLVAYARSRPPLPMLVGAGIALCSLCMAMRAVEQAGVAAVLLLLMGFCQINFTASCNATLQSLAPDHLRGRVMGLYTLVFTGVTPLGAFLTGSVTEAFGALNGFFIDGGLGLLSALALLAWQRSRGLRLREAQPRTGD